MKFNINIWHNYRKEARAVGHKINSFKNEKGRIQLPREELEEYVAQITSILKQCSNYMDKCKIRMPAPLWKFKLDDKTTHLSDPSFAYGDRL